MKILKIIAIIFFTLLAYIGISQRNRPDGENNIYLGIISLAIAVILFISTLLKHFFHSSNNITKKRNTNQSYNLATQSADETSENISSAPLTQYVESGNTIYRTDGRPISDKEIPYLINVGYEEALQAKEKSSNPKHHRTDREEELCVQFMVKHRDDIQKHTFSFEEMNRTAYSEKDLNTKIELLQKVIELYEKEKEWFYRTKGGMIYFQDYYEHMHNSRSEDFSYIDSVRDYLEYNIHKRDYVIPEIIHIIASNGGIIQRDIYKYLPNESKSDIQKIIRELEENNIISRTKQGNSYFLTLNH